MNQKHLFPIFSNNPELVYLDNAATTQKPLSVINSLVEFYSKHNANVHRGLYPLSDKATEMYEEARKKIAKFINAKPEEIFFTSGTTDGINIIANALQKSQLIPNQPKVILSEIEHHSNILPWQSITGEIFYLPVINTPAKIHKTGEDPKIDTSKLWGISKNEHYFPIESPFDILSISHASNVTGSITDIKEIIKLSRYHNTSNAITLLDASQSIGHMRIDVKDLDVDFMVFSGHKMYGPTGVGVVYGKQELLEELQPFKVGGGMIESVNRDNATWAELPEKFEAGTPPIADAIALGAAVDFINSIGLESIEKHEQDLRMHLISELQKLDDVQIYHPDISEAALGVVSIYSPLVHSHDLADFIGNRNICLRAGHHCTQILHREVFEIPASLRISVGIYNSKDDIDKMIGVLKEALQYYS
jgi:cysteine desulfurase/selenocysteine lyase